MDMIAVELGYLDVGAIQIGPDARLCRIVRSTTLNIQVITCSANKQGGTCTQTARNDAGRCPQPVR